MRNIATVTSTPCVACGQPLAAHRGADNESAGCNATWVGCRFCGPVAITSRSQRDNARRLVNTFKAGSWTLRTACCPRCEREVDWRQIHLGGER